MIEIRWHGRGGQGSFTASKLLGIAASVYEGKHALAFPAFGPERRGAPVQAFTKIDDRKITDRSEIRSCDYIVLLDETLMEENILKDVKATGKIIVNSSHPEKYKRWESYPIIPFDGTAIAMEILKRPITNTAMLGALLGISGMISLDSAVHGLQDLLEKSILSKNIEVLKRSYQKCKEASQ